ncbi:helix-turn-helix domain-containing protein [Enterobacter hormaechei]|uniref:helix-turn-helix domain-containing protein n=1 Tax=Enterobacter hormaechei TaxID=158836 RepID=UPI0026F15A2C|nr:helix-turn-helix domain-containing protein [Enterobacter hormaechei]
MTLDTLKLLTEQLQAELPWINVIDSQDQHQEALALLEQLMASEMELAPVIRLVSMAIEKYEAGLAEVQLFDEKAGALITGLPALIVLMNAHKVKNVDLVDMLGSTSLVSQIVNGKRNLTIPQIKTLAKFFNVPPSVFL